MDAGELLERAQACLDQLPPAVDMAEKFYEKAAEVAPGDADVLDAFGEFHATFGDAARARQLFDRSVELAPDVHAPKYFFLGQLSEGKEAVAFYRRGVTVSDASGAAEPDAVASALVSICELYMTDLCDEPEARGVCEESLADALRRSPEHFEAAVQQAVFQKTVGVFDAAKVWAEKACAKLKVIGEDLDARPPAESRMRLVETLLDLQLPEPALGVLHDLLEEDEEDVPTWYLLACAHQQEAAAAKDDADREDAVDAASECLEKAEKLVKKAGGEVAEEWGPRLACLREEVPMGMDED